MRLLTYKQVRFYTSGMQAKLTLRLEDRLIRRAKRLAAQRGKSVSEMVSGYFETLGGTDGLEEGDLPPLTRKLRGALRDAGTGEADYRIHLEEKYR